MSTNCVSWGGKIHSNSFFFSSWIRPLCHCHPEKITSPTQLRHKWYIGTSVNLRSLYIIACSHSQAWFYLCFLNPFFSCLTAVSRSSFKVDGWRFCNAWSRWAGCWGSDETGTWFWDGTCKGEKQNTGKSEARFLQITGIEKDNRAVSVLDASMDCVLFCRSWSPMKTAPVRTCTTSTVCLNCSALFQM